MELDLRRHGEERQRQEEQEEGQERHAGHGRGRSQRRRAHVPGDRRGRAGTARPRAGARPGRDGRRRSACARCSRSRACSTTSRACAARSSCWPAASPISRCAARRSRAASAPSTPAEPPRRRRPRTGRTAARKAPPARRPPASRAPRARRRARSTGTAAARTSVAKSGTGGTKSAAKTTAAKSTGDPVHAPRPKPAAKRASTARSAAAKSSAATAGARPRPAAAAVAPEPAELARAADVGAGVLVHEGVPRGHRPRLPADGRGPRHGPQAARRRRPAALRVPRRRPGDEHPRRARRARTATSTGSGPTTSTGSPRSRWRCPPRPPTSTSRARRTSPMAIARRRIKTGGDVKAALSLIPITKPVYASYREMLEREYPHLLAVDLPLRSDRALGRLTPGGWSSITPPPTDQGNRPGSGIAHAASREASPSGRTPPAEAAGRIARRRRGHDRGPAAFLCPALSSEPVHERRDVEERVRATGLLAPGTPVTVLLSGGRDSVCLLDLALRLAGRDASRALHVDYGLRDSAAADEAHCAELCARLEVPLEVRHPRRAGRRQPAGVGARPALRRGRPGRAAPRRRRGHGPHGDRPGRDRALPPRRLARAPGAARHAGALGPARAPAARCRRARRPPPTAARAG